MANQVDFSLPEQQNATFQVFLSPPANIVGWSIEVDFCYRCFSPQPIFSLYMASGYTNGQSGITLVNGTTGVFDLALNPSQVSGLSSQTNVLYYQTYRTDTGVKTPINGGFRLLTAF